MTLLRNYRRSSPLDALLRLQDDVGRIFESQLEPGDSRAGWYPPAEVYREEGALIVCLEVPGVEPEALSIESRGRCLVISGKRDTIPATAVRAGTPEPHIAEFSRSLEVPVDFDVARATATCKNGLLKVEIPLREEVQPRRIEIAAS